MIHRMNDLATVLWGSRGTWPRGSRRSSPRKITWVINGPGYETREEKRFGGLISLGFGRVDCVIGCSSICYRVYGLTVQDMAKVKKEKGLAEHFHSDLKRNLDLH
jgi:hypothetical protein